MLTQQHRFANQILHPQRQRIYKTHMCGLCHALGDGYGLPLRLLTSHELILLNLLVTAQRLEAPRPVLRRCPLNPLHHVTTNQDSASEFAAAAAIALAQVSLEDTLRDGDGGRRLAHLTSRALDRSFATALKTLERFGFTPAALTQLGDRQAKAEVTETSDPAQPTAEASASLFAMTARLARQEVNELPLAIIGRQYGTYLYLADAYRDFPEDMQRGSYNPLRRFSLQTEDAFLLSYTGLQWLLERFRELRAEIERQLEQLQLYRDEVLLASLLTGPLTHLIDDLSYQVLHHRDRTFRFWGIGDILKAAFFFLPPSLLFYSGDCDCNCGDSTPDCGCDAHHCSCADSSCLNSPFGDHASCVDFSCIQTPCSPHNDCWQFACWDCSGGDSSRGDLCFACGNLDCGSETSGTGSSTSHRRKKKQETHETPPDQPSLD